MDKSILESSFIDGTELCYIHMMAKIVEQFQDTKHALAKLLRLRRLVFPRYMTHDFQHSYSSSNDKRDAVSHAIQRTTSDDN